MNNSRKLSGIVASSGKGKGLAVIVIGSVVQEAPPPGESYVVVADLTTPDLIPLMVHANAIVTDIGGLSSHAANVARELGIPCIVSTKYASKRINQDDLVEVDADNNIVTWIPVPSRCILCTKHPASQVLKTEHFRAIYDGYPVRDGHLLVIPRRHIQRLVELTQEEFTNLYLMIHQADEFLRVQYRADGYNIGLNNGEAAGQTVPHLHFHIVPRQNGDVPDPRGGIRNFLPNPQTEYPLKAE
jgi:diadenosine tetraphosphate (Ap4A) HIT family hydrolase/phosphohistidine swiveling domain-containing protein